ncbi:MAG: hypothetical protein QOH97_957 [Actinoplanes sp.]|jgi:hypothetical protein|nr:hypothetical protein [Actinoplanes sp.]
MTDIAVPVSRTHRPRSHLSVGYSRPELPDRGWVTAIGIGLWTIGVLPATAVFIALRESIKELFRRNPATSSRVE